MSVAWSKRLSRKILCAERLSFRARKQAAAKTIGTGISSLLLQYTKLDMLSGKTCFRLQYCCCFPVLSLQIDR